MSGWVYEEDESMTLRNSVDNPEVNRVYTEFYGRPLSEMAEKLLHTEYTDRKAGSTER